MKNFQKILKNKRIFITGNTGFTGGWASLWLQIIGANLLGFSLPSKTSPSLFEVLNLNRSMLTIFGDICDYNLLKKSLVDFQPDLILHLAAQPLVSEGYDKPIETMNTNIIGTANILEISRYVENLKGVLCITTDKVYKNIEEKKKFIETDVLGGIDPYSASKSAAEIVIECFARSYFNKKTSSPIINVARGGNIIGGGDWSKNRLIPDYVRSVVTNKPLNIRSGHSIRPWQHVLDLVSGYFLILSKLYNGSINEYESWNLGPHEKNNYTVSNILKIMNRVWLNQEINYIKNHIQETKTLYLDSSKAKEILEWETRWETEFSIIKTVEWYKNFYAQPKEAFNTTLNQISEWEGSNL